MNLFQLLSEKNFGLFNADTGDRIRYFESTAIESNIVDAEDDDGNPNEDFDILALSYVIDSDYVYFRADAEVVRTEFPHSEFVRITDMRGRTFMFEVYRPLTRDEVFA